MTSSFSSSSFHLSSSGPLHLRTTGHPTDSFSNTRNCPQRCSFPHSEVRRRECWLHTVLLEMGQLPAHQRGALCGNVWFNRCWNMWIRERFSHLSSIRLCRAQVILKSGYKTLSLIASTSHSISATLSIITLDLLSCLVRCLFISLISSDASSSPFSQQMPFHLSLRLWDTYLSEGLRFSDFLIYLCARYDSV